jgi:hypothetical protein
VHRRTLRKQSLQGQVSAKLTPEICINNASSNGRLTAVGRWATAADTILRTVSRLFFFLSFFDETTTKLHLHAEKLTESVLHLNLGHFVVFSLFCVVLFGLVWFFSPLMRQQQNYSETPSPGLEAEGLTPKLLRLKLYCIWTWRFFIYLFILSIYFSQSSLCLSNDCSAYCWSVHYLSLFISLKLVLFVYLFFPLSLTSLLSHSSYPSILNITTVIITS